MIDLSAAWNGRIFSEELPEAELDVQAELALLAPGAPNRRVFISSSEERVIRVAMGSLEGPWARYGGFVPAGVGTIIIDPLVWARHLVGLAEICLNKGINLVSDERRTSPGLSGHPFFCEAFGVRPDAIILGRGWANGEDFYGFIARPSRLTEPLPCSQEAHFSSASRTIAYLRQRGLEMAREKGRLIEEFVESRRIPARGAGMLWLLGVTDPYRIAARLASKGFAITISEGSLVLAPTLDLPEDSLIRGLRLLSS
ncbi:MAG: hypothetical protein ABIM74_10205 [candidate division WOR-3 bacterium]